MLAVGLSTVACRWRCSPHGNMQSVSPAVQSLRFCTFLCPTHTLFNYEVKALSFNTLSLATLCMIKFLTYTSSLKISSR